MGWALRMWRSITLPYYVTTAVHSSRVIVLCNPRTVIMICCLCDCNKIGISALVRLIHWCFYRLRYLEFGRFGCNGWCYDFLDRKSPIRMFRLHSGLCCHRCRAVVHPVCRDLHFLCKSGGTVVVAAITALSAWNRKLDAVVFMTGRLHLSNI